MSSPEKHSSPWIIWVIVVLLLTAMFTYAQYFDRPSPEKTVNAYYESYFSQDYKGAARNLSVFMAGQYLVQYAESTPQELLASRRQIESDMAELITSIEATTPSSNHFAVDILSEHTRTGEYSALVVNHILHNDEVIGMEVVILIKEDGHYKIFEFSPIQEQMLEEVKNFDLGILDQSFSQLLQSSS